MESSKTNSSFVTSQLFPCNVIAQIFVVINQRSIITESDEYKKNISL